MTHSSGTLSAAGVSEISSESRVASLALCGLPDRPDIASLVLAPLGRAQIAVDLLVQQKVGDGNVDLTFTVDQNDYRQALIIIEQLIPLLGNVHLQGNDRIAKFSLSGPGLWQQPDIAKTLFETLDREAIGVHWCVTSENIISVVIDDIELEKVISVLHRTFSLELLPVAEV